MKVTAKKLTGLSEMRRACEMTLHSGKASRMWLPEIYKCEHSPIRTQMFWIEMCDIPTYVSVHFVRHKVGVEHFVMSNREDRGGTGKEDRMSPVNHGMFLNAQTLIQLARKRLCGKADPRTRKVMKEVVKAVDVVDPALTPFLVPECVYRNGYCLEPKSCGYIEKLQEERKVSGDL